MIKLCVCDILAARTKERSGGGDENGQFFDRCARSAPSSTDFLILLSRRGVLCASRRNATRRRYAEEERASLRLRESVLARPRCGDFRRGALSCVNFAPRPEPAARRPFPSPLLGGKKRRPPPLRQASGALTLVRLRLVTHEPEPGILGVPPPSSCRVCPHHRPVLPPLLSLDPFRPSPATALLPIAEGLFLAARRRSFSARLVVVATVGEVESVV